MLAELSPAEPEVHGLTALMEIQASRMRARDEPGVIMTKIRAESGPKPQVRATTRCRPEFFNT